MTQEQFDVRFQGADGAIRFATADMAEAFQQVAHKWPVSDVKETSACFAVVRTSGSRWAVDVLCPEKRKTVKHDPVNAICDLVVELNWSRLRCNKELMCLHAAGVRMGGSLVVFPSRRRAGKSTLTSELARRGHQVFTDDILAVQVSQAGVPEGLATGVAPRLRLPLPPQASHGFDHWVANDPGPSNKQYKYLTQAPVASFGQAAPIGAIVVLDRVEGDIAPVFSKMDIRDVIPILVYQNFGRFANAQRILAVFSAIASDLPCLKLSYGGFEHAADVLEAAVDEGLLAKSAIADTDYAPLPDFDVRSATFDLGKPYCQRKGLHCVETGDEAFISDANGLGIFRLGPGMLPIWYLLAEPMTVDEITSVLSDVFPDTDADTLMRDTRKALGQLNGKGLIVPVDS